MSAADPHQAFRFLSEGRGEWPDIDLDPPSEDKREQAIYSFFDRIDKAHEDADSMRHTASMVRLIQSLAADLVFPWLASP